jgi:hypothetical protein
MGNEGLTFEVLGIKNPIQNPKLATPTCHVEVQRTKTEALA